MTKKSKERTFSYLRRESPLEKQGVKGDSLLTRGCRQGIKHFFNSLLEEPISDPAFGSAKISRLVVVESFL